MPTGRDINGNTLKIPVDDFEYVTVNKEIPLELLAQELRLDKDIMKNLNLALVKGTTPPHQKYDIRLPYGMKKTAEYVLNELY